MINDNSIIKQGITKNSLVKMKDENKLAENKKREEVENIFTKLYESKNHHKKPKIISVHIIYTYEPYMPLYKEINKMNYQSLNCVSEAENKFISSLSKPYYPKKSSK